MTCSRCDYTTYEELPALGHNYATDWSYDTDAHYHVCLREGCGEKADTAPHTYDGELDADCNVCGAVRAVVCSHPTSETVTGYPATCTDAGMTDGEKCTACGEIVTAQVEIPALGHDEIPHEAQAPDCTEIGWEAYVTCSRCDYTTYEEIPALGHDEIPHEAQEPDCIEIGWDAYVTCSRCDYTTYEELPALGHDEIPHEAQAPTYTEVGWEAYVTCSRCDYTTYVEIPVLPPPVGDQIGETCIAADVTLLNQEGTFSVAENRGKVTVLNFWGSWCPPCVAELPHFDQIAAEYADSVTVVAIHSYGGMAQAAPFIQTNYPDTEILFGVDGVNEDYCVQLGGGQYWPMTVIVDANGVITHKRIGALTYNQLKAMIDEALGA